MEGWWNQNPIHRWPGNGRMMELKDLKKEVKEWSRNLSSSSSTLATLSSQLQESDALKERGLLSSKQRSSRIGIKSQILDLTVMEYTHWRRRCKLQWLMEEDENSRFSHLILSAGRRENTITE